MKNKAIILLAIAFVLSASIGCSPKKTTNKKWVGEIKTCDVDVSEDNKAWVGENKVYEVTVSETVIENSLFHYLGLIEIFREVEAICKEQTPDGIVTTTIIGKSDSNNRNPHNRVFWMYFSYCKKKPGFTTDNSIRRDDNRVWVRTESDKWPDDNVGWTKEEPDKNIEQPSFGSELNFTIQLSKMAINKIYGDDAKLFMHIID